MRRDDAARRASPATVAVRYAFVDTIAPSLRTRLLRCLSDEERARHGRFRAEVDRDGYLAAHALLRVELARRTGTAPETLRFETRAGGKPELSWRPTARSLTFSLTHARGFVACAIARGVDVGIDAEDLERRAQVARLEARVLSERERAALSALDAEGRRRRFFETWSLKEAYAKATGRGMGRTLGVVEFEFAPRRVEIRFRAGRVGDPRAWSFRLLAAPRRHVLAVAVRARSVRVTWSEVALPRIGP